MYLQTIKTRTHRRLFEELRKVRLLHDPNILPYQDAKLEIRCVHPRDFQPSALYLLRSELRFLALLMDEMVQKVGNMAKMNSLLEYDDEFGEHWRMIPPVVEYTDFGEWMILDGEHRSFIADMRSVKIPMLFISGVNPRAPYPCKVLPQGWESVGVCDAVPKFKRFPREGLNDTEETKYHFRRDLSAFGSQGIRPSNSI